MNRKQLTLVVVLAVILGGAALLLTRRQAASFQQSGTTIGQKVLPDFPLNDVATVVIRQGSNSVTLVRNEEQWLIKERHDYTANFAEVSDLLRKFWDLKVVQTEQVGPSQLPRLELVEPSAGGTGTLLEFQDKSNKTLRSVLLGKKHVRKSDRPSPFGDEGGFPDGRYLLVVGGSKDVLVVSEPFSEVEPRPDRWISKDFFKVEKLKSVAVTHAAETNSWALSREIENGEMKLAELKAGEQLDTAKSAPVGNALSYPSFTDVVAPGASAAETGLDQPIVARLSTFDGFNYTVRIGKKTGEENYHLQVAVAGDFPKERTPGADEKPEDKERLDKEFKEKLGKLEEKLKKEKAFEKWTYLVSKWTVDALLKERKDLLLEKKDESKPADGAGTPVPLEPPPAGTVVPPAGQ